MSRCFNLEASAFVGPFVRGYSNFSNCVGQMFFCFHRGQFFQGAIFALWIALWGLLPKAEAIILNNYSHPTTSILLMSANNVDEDDEDWQGTSYTRILLLLLV